MMFGNPWGLCALLSIPVILILHMFRRRYQPRKISALFLFGPEEFNQASGRTREKLRRTASLIAELIAALAFTWFLSDPHFNDHQSAKHVILILDGHQRMLARDNAGISSLEKARDNALLALNELEQHDRATLIRSGQQAQLLTATAVPIPVAKLALEKWVCDRSAHDLQASIELASDLQAASKHAQVVLFTDFQRSQLPDKWQCLSFGSVENNSGIIDARWIDDERGSRIALRIFRHQEQGARSLIISDNNNKELSRHALAEKVGTQQQIIPVPVKYNSGELHVHLDGQDALEIDNACTLIKPPSKRIRVSVEESMPLRSSIVRALASTAQVDIVEGSAHINIDQKQKTMQAGTWYVQIKPGTGESVIGPFLARSGHPLLQDVDFTGTLWSKAHALIPIKEQSLLQAAKQCLISEQFLDGHRLIKIYVDLEQSSLHRHPSWPSIFANLVAWRLDFVPGFKHYHVSSHMNNRVVLPPGHNALIVHHPNNEAQRFLPDQNGIIILPRISESGLYKTSVEQENKDTNEWHSFIVHRLSKQSSDLSQCSTDINALSVDGSGKVQRVRTRLEHIIPLAICIIAALAAWILYTREQGVRT